MKYYNEMLKNSLVWLPERGIGFYPVKAEDMPYDESYFQKYQEMANTPIGKALCAARVSLVKKHWCGEVLDVGIGSGAFIEAHGNAKGFDVNPAGIKYLKDASLWGDLYAKKWSALCLWDSLEHLYNPESAVANAIKWIFVSIPIFQNAEHILRSHHYRKDEHIFYFTHDGLVNWFKSQGFSLAEHNVIESDLGRDGIGSYAFKRD